MSASRNSNSPCRRDIDGASALPMFWLFLFASISAVGLLFAFQHVVYAAVDRAASKRIDASAETRNAWLCKAGLTLAERQGCVSAQSAAQLKAKPTASVTHTTLPAAVLSLP